MADTGFICLVKMNLETVLGSLHTHGKLVSLMATDSFSRYKTRVIPNNVCIVISTQFNLNCIFRIDLIHLQQKSLQGNNSYVV